VIDLEKRRGYLLTDKDNANEEIERRKELNLNSVATVDFSFNHKHENEVTESI